MIVTMKLGFIYLVQESLNILFHPLDTLDVLDCVVMRVGEDSAL